MIIVGGPTGGADRVVEKEIGEVQIKYFKKEIFASPNPCAAAFEPTYEQQPTMLQQRQSIIQQQQQTHAYRNATQDDRQESQVNKIQMDENPKTKPLWDPHVQLTNQNFIHSLQSLHENDETAAIQKYYKDKIK